MAYDTETIGKYMVQSLQTITLVMDIHIVLFIQLQRGELINYK